MWNTKIYLLDNTNSLVFQKNYVQGLENIMISDLECVNNISNYIIIITDTDTNMKNKKIIHEIDNCEFNFKLSNITFIALYLNYNDDRYNINLKTDEFNFYLVGNIINKSFIQYYLTNILHNDVIINVEDNTGSYTLELMDHEVNVLLLNDNQYIIIEENGYCIGEYLNNSNTMVITETTETTETTEKIETTETTET